MKFGFVYPFNDPRAALSWGVEAEQAGWDGFFMWEPVWGTDCWVTLGAIAARTSRIRLGTLLTPVTRRRPWKLASETATLDQISGGRVILSVGLGAVDTGFETFGEETDRKIRAERLDEGLAILDGLWHGQPFAFEGKHYHVKPTDFIHKAPPPIQQPRIPVWVVGAWPYPKSMERALRWDGLLAAKLNSGDTFEGITPDLLREITPYVRQRRPEGYDIIAEGVTPANDAGAAREQVRALAEAGATWFIESQWDKPEADVLARLRAGPAAP